MLFQTPTFGLFLILVVLGATLLDRRAKAHQLFLLVASYIFYGAWDWRFLGLILFSTVLDYSVGLGIQRSSRPLQRKLLLTASIVFLNFITDIALALIDPRVRRGLLG